MTAHKTGTREQWLAARLELLKANLLSSVRHCRGFGLTRTIASTPMTGAHR